MSTTDFPVRSMSREQRVHRIAELREAIRDMDRDAGGEQFDKQARDAWNTLNAELDEHKAAVAELTLQATRSGLEAEIQIACDARERLARPEGLTLGIVVLSYFALVGTVFPLIVMAVDPVPRGAFIRAAVVVAFVTGFAALLGYVAWAVRRLR